MKISLLLIDIINDIFLLIANNNLCNYIDDKALYAINRKLHLKNSNLDVNFTFMQRWFYENHMVLNPGKYNYMLINNYNEPDELNLNSAKFVSSNNDL